MDPLVWSLHAWSQAAFWRGYFDANPEGYVWNQATGRCEPRGA